MKRKERVKRLVAREVVRQLHQEGVRVTEAMAIYQQIKLAHQRVEQLSSVLDSLQGKANNALRSAIAVKGRGHKDVRTLRGILDAVKKAGGAMKTVEDEIYNAERWGQSIDLAER